MSLSVDSVSIVQDFRIRKVEDLSLPSCGSRVTIYGDPMHIDENALVTQYRRDSLKEFLAKEARYSIGNYVLVEESDDFCRMITAPGYCGGYFYTKDKRIVAGTHLSAVLSAQKDKIEMAPFGLSFFVNYTANGCFQQLPFSTMFKHVSRIPPAIILEFERGTVVSYSSYLLASSVLPPPASFEAAIDEVTDGMARYYERSETFPSIMFSGGGDSLILYLALREKMDPKDIRVFTMHHSQHSITNGPMRAIPIAEKLNFEVEYLSDDYLESENVGNFVKSMMQKDIPNGRGPHLAFADHVVPKSDILHGQNMDTIINIKMLVMHANLEKGYLSKEMLDGQKTDAQELLQYRTFVRNLQYTDVYSHDKEFQELFLPFYKSMTTNTIPDPDPGGEGVFRGMISSQEPNLLIQDRFPFDQMTHLDSEVARFKTFAGEKALDPDYGTDLLRHFTWSHLANKRISSFALPGGSRTFPPATAGAFSSYYIGRKRTAATASHPKKELYDLIKKKSGGIPYTQLFSGKTEPEKWKKDNSNDDPVVRNNMRYINPDDSAVLDSISEPLIRNHVEEIYRSVEKSCQPHQNNFLKFNQARARKFLNLELLIAEARKMADTSA